MAKQAAPKASKDVDFTVPGLLAIVAIVLFTAIFFRGGSTTIAATGGAYETGITADVHAPDSCEASSYCDGTRLIRQHDDCNQYVAHCQYGCEQLDGHAQCR